MTPFALPSGYSRIQRVRTFAELVAAPFEDGINAVCWERKLPGDFGAVVAALGQTSGVDPIEESRLESLSVSADGRVAIAVMLEDLRRLREHTLDPVLNCITQYPRDEHSGPVKADVLSFHVDSAPLPAATWLCTYYGRPSEGLRNDEAVRRVDLAETRAELLKEFGGDDDHVFHDFLADACYDLHYAPLPNARPFSFGIGNIWRIACEYPDSAVPPCIHRAPDTGPGDTPRLLLIS